MLQVSEVRVAELGFKPRPSAQVSGLPAWSIVLVIRRMTGEVREKDDLRGRRNYPRIGRRLSESRNDNSSGRTLHPRGLEQSPRVLAPLFQKGSATLENFPALSNGVRVLFPLGSLICTMRKLPQTLEKAVIPLFSYKILRRDGSQRF